MSTESQKLFVISGIQVWVDYPATPDLGKPAAVLFLLHGRFGNCKDAAMSSIRKGLLESASGNSKDLYIVTFDQRNHGHRLVDQKHNEGWNKDPERHNAHHAIDMYTMQLGTATDVSFLIDVLPSYMFPSGEQHIQLWGVAGVSLGGHASWLALTHEPRLTLGIPIIGCPDYLTLISARAEKFGISLDDPEYFPDGLCAFIQNKDPVSSPSRSLDATNPFLGKKILVLSGADDPLVPWTASEDFVKHLNVGSGGVKQVIVQPGAKHETTPEMVKNLVDFVHRHAL